jgi:hypothetical protein
MLKTKLARTGLIIGLLGIAILGASLFTWNQTSPSNRLYYTTHQYQWVDARLFNEPGVATDEVWNASAECLKPFYMKAVEQAKAKLRAHNDTNPTNLSRDEQRLPEFEKREQIIRATVAVSGKQGRALTSWEIKSVSDALERNNYNGSIDPDWFLALFKLEEGLKDWESQASKVEDKEFLLSKLLDGQSKSLNPGDSFRLREALRKATNDQAKTDLAAKYHLGLADFSDAESMIIRATCVYVFPMKKVAVDTTYHSELGRWPVEHVAAFWLGVGLMIFGLLLSPVAKWIGSAEK